MKTNSTLLRYAVLCIVVLGLSLQSKADNIFGLNFNQAPSAMQASTAYIVGNKFKFGSVASGTDAIVTIVSATGGATVAMLDDNTTTRPEAFSPQINIPAFSTGMVEFKIEFVNGGGNPRVIDTLRATAYDIDGSATIHEMDMLDMGSGSLLSFLASALQINVVPTLTQYLATNIGGIEYTGVDTSAKQVMFTLARTNISSFTYKAGAINLGGATMRQKGIYFKGFNYVAAAPLPVKYSAFDAVVVDKSVVLNWITEQEIDNNYFDVERSFDGSNFTSIGIVLDGIANGTRKNYQFKDNDAQLQSKTLVYYRLKQVDNNAKYTYTNKIAVKLKATDAVVMQTSPNPFVESLNVRFTSATAASAQITIINENGQQVVNKIISVSKGYNNVQVDGLAKLARGVYVAHLTTGGTLTATQKIIKN